MPNPSPQTISDGYQTILSQDWFRPDLLKKFINALRIWPAGQKLTTIDGQYFAKEHLTRELLRVFQSLPSSRKQALIKQGITEIKIFQADPDAVNRLEAIIDEIAGLKPFTPESNLPDNLKELVLAAQQKEAELIAAKEAIFQYTTADQLTLDQQIKLARQAQEKIIQSGRELEAINRKITEKIVTVATQGEQNVLATKYIQNLKDIANTRNPVPVENSRYHINQQKIAANTEQVVTQQFRQVINDTLRNVQQTIIESPRPIPPQQLKRLFKSTYLKQLHSHLVPNAAVGALNRRQRQQLQTVITNQISQTFTQNRASIQTAKQTVDAVNNFVHPKPSVQKQLIAKQIQEIIAAPAAQPTAPLSFFQEPQTIERLAAQLTHAPEPLQHRLIAHFNLSPQLQQSLAFLVKPAAGPPARFRFPARLTEPVSSGWRLAQIRSQPLGFLGNTLTNFSRGLGTISNKISSPFRSAGSLFRNRIGSPAKNWGKTTLHKVGVKLAGWGAVKKFGGGIFRRGLQRAAVRIGIKLGGKALGALIAQAVPVVGQIVGAAMLISAGIDVAQGLWQNKEKLAPAVFALGTTGLLLLSKFLGFLGTAAWTLGGGLIGGIAGFFVGGPIGAAIGAGVGASVGAWIGSGGLATAISGLGTALGSAATGIGTFLGNLSAPALTSSLASSVTSAGVIGGGVAIGSVALISFTILANQLVVPSQGSSGFLNNASCPINNGTLLIKSYDPTTDTGHGSTTYWRGLFGDDTSSWYSWPLPQQINCNRPSDCDVYGFAIDVFPIENDSTVYFPQINGEDVQWSYSHTFENPDNTGWSHIYTSGNYSIILTHLAQSVVKGSSPSGTQIGSLYDQGGNTHLHLEFAIDGVYQKPEDFFCAENN